MNGQGAVEIWQRGDGAWRWRYRPPGDHPSILSNERAITFEDARDAAARAYPGADLVLLERPPESGRRATRPGTIGRALLAAGGAAALLVGGRIALAILRSRRRLRRFRRG